MAQAKVPAVQVITPDRLQVAAERANAERERIRKEAHEDGKQHGLRLAGRYRDVAMVAIGFAVGFTMGAALIASVYERGAMGATAIVDQVIGRTVPDPNAALPPPLETRDPGAEYERNAARAREGCTAAELRAGRRECRNAP